MSLIPFPTLSQACPVAMGLRPNAVTRAHASAFGGDGAEAVVDLLQDRWRATLELSPSQLQDAGAVEAWLAAQRGGANTTPLHHMGRPVPLGTLGRVYPVAGMAGDAAQGASSVLLATANNATLLAGDLFRVGGDAAGQGGLLLQCAANCAAPAAGEGYITVPIVNRLRRAVTGFRRASTATLVDAGGVLQTVAANVLRYQGGVPLVEAEGTNLISAPEAFDSGAWTKQGTTVAPGLFDPAPNGVQFVADAVQETAANESHNLYALATANGRAFSVFAKPAGVRYIGLWAFVGGVLTGRTFDLVAGTQGAVWPGTGALVSSFIQPLAGGYFRVGIAANADFSVCVIQLRQTAGTGQEVYAGNPANSVYLWGAQMEPGPTTSYMPATRAADLLPAVEWNRPARPFRLASGAGLRHVAGYAEGLALDFVEDLNT